MNLQVNTTTAVVTPEMARKYLEKNTHNRKASDPVVRKYAEVMRRGEWILNPADPICISEDGRLLNGQHRLLAVVKSGIACPFVVAINVDEKVQYVMDTGKKRSATDALSLIGASHSSTLASIIKLYLFWRETQKSVLSPTAGNMVAVTPSVVQILNEYEGDEEWWREVTTWARRMREKNKGRLLLLPESTIGGIYAHLVKDLRHNEDAVRYFFEGVCSSKESPNSAIETLRVALINDSFNLGRKMKDRHKVAILIKAFNAYIKGREIKQLRFSPKVEKFPEFI
jgi:hypothetical protein